jgi:hypothetical protein
MLSFSSFSVGNSELALQQETKKLFHSAIIAKGLPVTIQHRY